MRDEGLSALPELYVRRSPGKSCLSAMESGQIGRISTPINESRGCGGVTRVAPVGLLSAALHEGRSLSIIAREAFNLGCAASAITHGHPCGYLPAGAFASIIAQLIAGMPLEGAVQESISILRAEKGCDESVQALTSALKLGKALRGAGAKPSTVAMLGEGWRGEEALAIAVFCAIEAQGDFAKGVLLAVNHDGDSDSTAAIAGNLLGALLGASAIPKRWGARVEFGKILTEMARRLFALSYHGKENQLGRRRLGTSGERPAAT
jgi:ADP-ribosylglycohydrolase